MDDAVEGGAAHDEEDGEEHEVAVEGTVGGEGEREGVGCGLVASYVSSTNSDIRSSS